MFSRKCLKHHPFFLSPISIISLSLNILHPLSNDCYTTSLHRFTRTQRRHHPPCHFLALSLFHLVFVSFVNAWLLPNAALFSFEGFCFDGSLMFHNLFYSLNLFLLLIVNLPRFYPLFFSLLSFVLLFLERDRRETNADLASDRLMQIMIVYCDGCVCCRLLYVVGDCYCC